MIFLKIIKRWFKVPFLHRTLFWGFVRNEIKGRYAGSMGGFIWGLLTPLMNLLIYIFVFSVILKIKLKPMETGTASFAIYFLSGLLPWMAFSEALNSATDAFLGRGNLITKVAFPLEILPLTGVIVPFCLNGLGFLMFLVYLIYEGYWHWAWLWLPVVVLVHMVFTLGLVTLIASVSVFLRDVKQFMGTVLSLWFFMTPIIYPAAMVPEKFEWVLKLNPAYPFVTLYQQVLLFHGFSPQVMICAVGLAVASFWVGVLFFRRCRNAFADVL